MPKDNSSLFLSIAEALMSQAAAPYHEEGVAAVVRQICRQHRIPLKKTPCGNLIATVKRGRAGRAMVMAAHMDHPGFVIGRQEMERSWRADFLGGVPDRYFKKGLKLRLQPGNFPATLGERRLKKKRSFDIHTKSLPEVDPRFAVWDLTPFRLKGRWIHGRACDDLIGLASALTTLALHRKGRKPVHAIAFVSRAEEVGFHGALMETLEKRLPKDPLVLSLETSSEMPPVRQGDGVIVRVGDRSSVFDSKVTRFLTAIAEKLKQGRSADFRYQRALMQGGSCEGTAFQEFGYQTGALCVALGNYHNCGEQEQVREENIHLDDALGMVRLLSEAAVALPSFLEITVRTTRRLEKLRKEASEKLG